MKNAAFVIPVAALLVGATAYLLYTRETTPPPPAPVAADEVVAPLADAVTLVTRAGKLESAERTALLNQARARLVALERNHANDVRLPFWRGVVDVMLHKETDASTAYDRVCALAPSGARNSQALYLRSIHLLEFDPDRAADAVRKLRTLRAQSPDFLAEPVSRALFRALVVVHGIQTRNGDVSKAIDSLKEALRIVDEKSELALVGRRALAYAYGRAGEWPDAERLWQELVKESNGRVGEPLFELAASYAAQNRWADADVEYSRVVALLEEGRQPPAIAKTLHVVYLRRGNCRRLLERYADAKADLETYLKLEPDDHRGQYWLGMIWNDGFQKPDVALALWEKARAAAPWCDNYPKAMISVYETTLPDPAKAKALRDDLAAHKQEHEDERTRRALAGEYGGILCE